MISHIKLWDSHFRTTQGLYAHDTYICMHACIEISSVKSMLYKVVLTLKDITCITLLEELVLHILILFVSQAMILLCATSQNSFSC